MKKTAATAQAKATPSSYSFVSKLLIQSSAENNKKENEYEQGKQKADVTFESQENDTKHDTTDDRHQTKQLSFRSRVTFEEEKKSSSPSASTSEDIRSRPAGKPKGERKTKFILTGFANEDYFIDRENSTEENDNQIISASAKEQPSKSIPSPPIHRLDQEAPLSHHPERQSNEDETNDDDDEFRSGITSIFRDVPEPRPGMDRSSFRREMSMLRHRSTKFMKSDRHLDYESDESDYDSDDHSNNTEVFVKMISEQLGGKKRSGKMVREHLEEAHMGEDTFSFFITSPFRSQPFMVAVTVLAMKTVTFGLIAADIIDSGDSKNPFQIPAAVSTEVSVSQFLAVFITVVTQDDLISALLLLSEGYSSDLGYKFPAASYPKWTFAVFALFMEGLLGVGVTFLLIVTSDEVLDLLLNFTAIEFVSYLDNIAYELSKKGFFGSSNKRQALLIENSTYYVRVGGRARRERCQFITLIMFLLLLVVAWITIFQMQANGVYQSKSLHVQFDDTLNKALGAYSGLYTLQMQYDRISGFDRIRYVSSRSVSHNDDAFFGYCQVTDRWTFSTVQDSGIDDPCQGILAQSHPTPAYDITETSELDWFAVLEDFSTRAFEMDGTYIHAGCLTDDDCGGEGRGYCGDMDTCICEDRYYGLWCDYNHDTTCTKVEIENSESRFTGSREYATEFALQRRPDNGKVVEVYNRPIYVGKLPGSDTMDVVLYEGLHWVMLHAKDGLKGIQDPTTEEGVLQYFLQNPDFHAATQIAKIGFESEAVFYSTPSDAMNAAPRGLKWTKVRNQESLQDVELLETISATLICSHCHSTLNPCQFRNKCVDKVCVCENGATGKLCDILPVSDGKCDPFFNIPIFNYDGGDCCQSTCISTEQYQCGVRAEGKLDYIDVGFHDCIDPLASCSNSRGCWSPTGPSIPTLSKTTPAIITSSANSKTVVITEPDLDLVRVYDHKDSLWTPRGERIEGDLESDFGRVTAIHTLPGEVVSRRFGKLPVILAVSLERGNSRSVKVYEWASNAIDWTSPGTVKICDDGCEIILMSIATDDHSYRLAVELKNKTTVLYQSHFDDSGTKVWTETHRHDLSSTGFISFSGDGHTLLISEGADITAYNVSDKEVVPAEFYSLVNSSDPMFSAIEAAEIKNLKVSYDGKRVSFAMIATEDMESYNLYLASLEICHSCGGEEAGLGELVPIKRTRLGFDDNIEVQSCSFSDDGETVVLKLHNKTSSRYTVDVFTAGYESEDGGGKDGLTFAKTDDNGSRKLISEIGVSSGISVASASQSRGFVRVGDPVVVSAGANFSISDYGPTLTISEIGNVMSVSPPRACGTDEVDIRLSMSHDVHPDRVDWELETLIGYNGEFFVKRVNEECDHCYTPNEKFARTKVTEVMCKPAKDKDCIRFSYHHEDEHSVGEGFALFLNGTEIGRLNPDQDVNEMEIIQPSLNTSSECFHEELTCEDGLSLFAMVILVDDNPHEVSWSLYDSQGNFTIDFSAGNFTEISEFLIKQLCVPKDGCYVMTVKDEGHNGICCDEGSGYYTVFFEGQELLPNRSGNFGHRTSHVFGSGCLADFGCNPLPGSSSDLPVAVDLSNYDINGCSVQPLLCSDDEILAAISVTFDDYPNDLFWGVRNLETFEELGRSEDYESIHPRSTGYFQSCVSSSGCYLLQLYDANGDGICCSDGAGSISYKFGYDGDVIETTGDFGLGTLITVGDNCPKLATVNIEITLDNHPEQTYWQIYDPVHNVYMYNVSPYFYSKEMKRQTVSVEIKLLPETRYIFRLYDSFGDGIFRGRYRIVEEESLLADGSAYFPFRLMSDVEFTTLLG